MTLLALDLGTRTGWALDGDVVAHGFSDFRPGRFDGGGMRYLRFVRFLNELHAQRAISEVVYEEGGRHIAGKGNADKNAVMTAVRALGYPVRDINEADALALLLTAREARNETT